MKAGPLIEEICKTKDDLAREAGYDVHQFFNELRSWSAEHSGGALVLCNAEDLRRLAKDAESQRSRRGGMVLREGTDGSD